MAEYLSPGVYVEEIDAGPKPIAPVATSTAGAVGVALRGPTRPTLVTNYGDFVRTFGGPLDLPDDATQANWAARGHYWQAAESVKAFFDEGGARMFFQRVVPRGALASGAPFRGGLLADLRADVRPADTTLTLSHVMGIAAQDALTLVSAEGAAIGNVTVQSVDRAARQVTLTAAAGVNARRNRDVVAIRPIDPALTTLTATAGSAGAWGDDLRVRVMPVTGATRTLTATPASGDRIEEQTTALAATGTSDLTVPATPGALDGNTATPFSVRLNGGAPQQVTAVADAAPNVTLTLANALTADLPAGSTVTVLRPAVAGQVVNVSGADRLYPDALVELAGAAGVEMGIVQSVSGARVTLTAAPGNAYVEGDTVSVLEADVAVSYEPAGGEARTERFTGRLTAASDPNSFIARVNLGSRLVRLAAGADYTGTDPARFPAVATGGWADLTGGDDALGTLTAADFVGVNPGPGQRTGIQALEEIDQVAICVVPGMWDQDVRQALIIHCDELGDRFAILDPPPGLGVQDVVAFREPIDSTYAALYYPWVQITDPRPGGGIEDIAPSGFVAGVYARTDVARGVHKAPANEVLQSIRGFTQAITKREQDILNPLNINVLREFPGRGRRVWGSRVLTSDATFRYVPVRRLFLMIGEAIDEGTQWVVFEPNDEPLWARVRQSVRRFLETQWRLGALQGVTADEAFFVTCDRSTMSQDDIDNGLLICQIGIAPVKPAEFVVFRIQQKTNQLTT